MLLAVNMETATADSEQGYVRMAIENVSNTFIGAVFVNRTRCTAEVE